MGSPQLWERREREVQHWREGKDREPGGVSGRGEVQVALSALRLTVPTQKSEHVRKAHSLHF